MKRLIVLFLLLSTAAVCFASNKDKKKDETPHYRVGITFRQFNAPPDYDWRGSADHVLSAIIWYPAEANAEEKDIYDADPATFYAGRAAKDATMAPSFGDYPLVVLSHGTGGSALQMAWLGTYLASRGYIAVAVNHPGNNAVTGYTPQGFVEWWLRARDLSVVIEQMLEDRRFGSKIDRDRIGAAGFSLGGYTMIEIAGGITNFEPILAWCNKPENRASCNPPEFPDLVNKFQAMRNQPGIEQALEHAGESYRDARVKAVFAIAPALAIAFAQPSLQAIHIPVDIVAGDGDTIVPPPANAEYFAKNIPGSKLTILPGGVGHYTFLDVGTDLGKKNRPLLFVDNPGVDRQSVHKQVAELSADFFDKELSPNKKSKKK
ncbi:MAG TPA: hypothetical protein VGL89_18125 [Candidatus Koribacter sp.]|jgi:predicted dienelactone hydrolase